ncbi:hypothetical protein MKZ38_004963 [Zalerion maritima]|uniref:Uncharacterized protein n=1 Tax=Zalerion maritima TaxID=339359 RepID=A0AAD5WQM4_9PEZI|nr:hypothetical protein MKZ38_004963 [Zalerion maritima]
MPSYQTQDNTQVPALPQDRDQLSVLCVVLASVLLLSRPAFRLILPKMSPPSSTSKNKPGSHPRSSDSDGPGRGGIPIHPHIPISLDMLCQSLCADAQTCMQLCRDLDETKFCREYMEYLERGEGRLPDPHLRSVWKLMYEVDAWGEEENGAVPPDSGLASGVGAVRPAAADDPPRGESRLPNFALPRSGWDENTWCYHFIVQSLPFFEGYLPWYPRMQDVPEILAFQLYVIALFKKVDFECFWFGREGWE